MSRQLVDNEDYSLNIPQLQYEKPAPMQPPEQDNLGSDTRPRGSSNMQDHQVSHESSHLVGYHTIPPNVTARSNLKLIQNQVAAMLGQVRRRMQQNRGLRHQKLRLCPNLSGSHRTHRLHQKCRKEVIPRMLNIPMQQTWSIVAGANQPQHA